jgi:hypothetical protein
VSSDSFALHEEVHKRGMSAPDTYVRSDAVVSRLIGGETLVVPVRGGVGDLASIYTFNEVGTVIWEALASPRSLEALVDLIQRAYPVSRDQVLQDMVLFLSDIRSAGLLAIANVVEESDVTVGSAIMEPGMIRR